MQAVALSKVCEVTAGQAAPQDPAAFGTVGKPFIRAGSLENLVNGGREEDCELIPDQVARDLRLRLFPKDTILFAKSGMSATLGRIYRLKTPAYVVSHLAAVIPGPNIAPAYLQRWFERNPPSRLIPNEAYPSIRTSEISALKIELPKLDEQKRIAAILDKADAIRRKRQKAIQLADEFLRSVFLDMFGDPASNGRDWNEVPLDRLCKRITDGTHDTPPRLGSGVLLVTGKNIRPFSIDLSEVEYVSPNDHAEIYRRCNPEYLDVLYTNIGANVGTAALNTIRTPFSMKNVALLKPDREKLNSYYLEHALNQDNMKKKILHQGAAGGAQSFLGLATIRALLLPTPPTALQNKFGSVAEKVYKSSQSLLDLVRTSEQLFGSLSQRAFRGEL